MAEGSMTRAEREAFLADVHVGVLAVDDPGRGPLTLPIWYLVEDGDVVISMDDTSKKFRLLEAAGRASMVAQTEAPPYRYVSVEGPVRVVRPDDRDPLDLAGRYLGDFGPVYVEANPPNEHTVEVHLTPEHWNTMDFGKLLGL